MAKLGLSIDSCAQILREKCTHHGWVLCVGAGTSVPAFPSWESLVAKLMAYELSATQANRLARRLLERYSPDAVIQAEAHRSKLSPRKFARRLASALYADLKSNLTASEWRDVSCALRASAPVDMKEEQWRRFRETVESKYPNLSAAPIARMVAQVIGSDVSPVAILSFNAEPLLYALIIANQCAYPWKKGESADGAGWIKSPQRAIDRVIGASSYRKPNRIPFVHCHGLLPVPVRTKRKTPESIDKLVFSEGDYLQLANSSYSWQSSVFLEACATRCVVFIGVSLSDPNMRRWLSWTHASRIKELRLKPGTDSTTHFWINRIPKTEREKLRIECLVAHLGVRLVWVDEWQDIAVSLQLMLGIQLAGPNNG